jgi:hypothetical protein
VNSRCFSRCRRADHNEILPLIEVSASNKKSVYAKQRDEAGAGGSGGGGEMEVAKRATMAVIPRKMRAKRRVKKNA